MPTVSFLGCGRAGQVLGHLWHRAGALDIGQVLTRSAASAAEATARMGAGTTPASFSELAPADIFLLATPDQVIGDLAARLAGSGLADTGTITFHLGGALTSGVLRDAGIQGPVASIHPLRSFGDFHQSIDGFSGTYCACEGDDRALAILRPAFAGIGGRPFDIDTDSKLVYHAASVIISNYVNALVAAGMETYGLAGIDADTARAMGAPILRNTLENVLNRGPVDSLTGPIARGDWQLVARELEALRQLDPGIAEIYRTMGEKTLELAQQRGNLGPGEVARIKGVLTR